MEKYLNKETRQSLDELIDLIKNSNEYKEVIRLKKEINEDKELVKLIDEVRSAQQKYIKSNYGKKEKEEMDGKIELLNNNKLYVFYSYNLDKVNDMIHIICEELNDYFYSITNILQ